MQIYSKTIGWAAAIVAVILLTAKAKAQVSITGELRTRTEFRDGEGTLEPKEYTPAFFTSQRSRITFDYKGEHVLFHTTLQDVRVWGQDASTINNADGNRLSLHEAWAEIVLANRNDSMFRHSALDYFAVKIGRQEIINDDQRLMGNLDWLQQARRHDAVVFKFLNKGWQADLGVAFNQNTDAFNYNGTYYTPANLAPYVKDSKGNLAPTPTGFIPLVNAQGISSKSGTPATMGQASSNGLYQDYKALQYVYGSKTFNKTKISALFLADCFGKYINDSVKNIVGIDTGYIYGKNFNQKGVNCRVTGGLLVNSFLDREKRFTLTAGFYYQAGRDKDALKLSAYTSTSSISYTRDGFIYTLGWDYLSGNNSFSSSTTNHRFDPLYGTPHKFWGFMDYFYVGTGSPTGGLNDPNAKIRYEANKQRFSAEVDYHYFRLGSHQKDIQGDALKKYLGCEVDLVTTYALNKITAIEYGFSVMAASHSMEYAKNITPGTANLTGLWSYLMITIKPEFHVRSDQVLTIR
jgi:hypothetical protein